MEYTSHEKKTASCAEREDSCGTGKDIKRNQKKCVGEKTAVQGGRRGKTTAGEGVTVSTDLGRRRDVGKRNNRETEQQTDCNRGREGLSYPHQPLI